MIMPILNVNDVDASVAFYKDKLGFKHVMSMSPEGKNVFAIVNFSHGSDFGLNLNTDEGTKSAGFAAGVQFMVYLPDDRSIDDYYEQVSANGVTIDEELADTYWGDRAFTIHDPSGYMLTFAVTVQQVPVDQMEQHLRERDNTA